jgi:hypothetical protein
MKLPLPVKRILSYLPTALPVGLTAFNQFASDIIELTGPLAEEDSLRYVVATQILNLPSTRSWKPKAYFVSCIRKAAANQVASQVFTDIKEKQVAKSLTPVTPTAEVTAAPTPAVTNEEVKPN